MLGVLGDDTGKTGVVEDMLAGDGLAVGTLDDNAVAGAVVDGIVIARGGRAATGFGIGEITGDGPKVCAGLGTDAAIGDGPIEFGIPDIGNWTGVCVDADRGETTDTGEDAVNSGDNDREGDGIDGEAGDIAGDANGEND